MNHLKELIREVPDYPKPGILFYDLTTLLRDPAGFHSLVDALCDHYEGEHVDTVVGIEARGFILAPALAYRLGAGFVPVRKPRKLLGVKNLWLQEGIIHEEAALRAQKAGINVVMNRCMWRDAMQFGTHSPKNLKHE